MTHVGTWAVDSHATNSELFYKYMKKSINKMDEVFLAKINEKHPDSPKTMKWWKSHHSWDNYYYPDEAIEFGLLDRICD